MLGATSVRRLVQDTTRPGQCAPPRRLEDIPVNALVSAYVRRRSKAFNASVAFEVSAYAATG